MNTNLARMNRVMMDGWPVLVVYSAYVISFSIIATTMTSFFLVA